MIWDELLTLTLQPDKRWTGQSGPIDQLLLLHLILKARSEWDDEDHDPPRDQLFVSEDHRDAADAIGVHRETAGASFLRLQDCEWIERVCPKCHGTSFRKVKTPKSKNAILYCYDSSHGNLSIDYLRTSNGKTISAKYRIIVPNLIVPTGDLTSKLNERLYAKKLLRTSRGCIPRLSDDFG